MSLEKSVSHTLVTLNQKYYIDDTCYGTLRKCTAPCRLYIQAHVRTCMYKHTCTCMAYAHVCFVLLNCVYSTVCTHMRIHRCVSPCDMSYMVCLCPCVQYVSYCSVYPCELVCAHVSYCSAICCRSGSRSHPLR